jgi:CubicO group peptidase (beta-lactamase class C family)
VPAANGMATAYALARMYAACIGEVDGVRLIGADTLAAARAVQSAGDDLVTRYETRYGLGFQLSFPLRPFAGDGSVGHYGLGGSVGFAHPDLGFTFGYTVNQMLPGGVVDPRSKALIDAVVGCLSRRYSRHRSVEDTDPTAALPATFGADPDVEIPSRDEWNRG